MHTHTDLIRGAQIPGSQSHSVASTSSAGGPIGVKRISEAAVLSGISVANIRFYEKEKLILPSGVSENGYRFYREEDIHRLRFVRRLRSLDMSLSEVRTLLALDLRSKADCHTARGTLDDHLQHVKSRLKELRALEKDLNTLRDRCDGTADHCLLIEALHGQADAGAGTGRSKTPVATMPPKAGRSRTSHV